MTRLLFPFALLLTACPAGTDETDKSDTGEADADTDTDSDTDADTDADTDSDVDTALNASATGTITDGSGNPVENFRVNVCKELCKTQKTAADGTYTFSQLEPWTASWYVQGSSDAGYATPYAPVTWAENEDKVVDIALIPFGGDVQLNGAVDLGEALVLDGNGSSYLTPLNETVASVTYAYAEGNARTPIEIPGETVLTVVYLGPFEAHGSAMLSVRNAWGLPEGESVNVWYADLPEVSEWKLAGTATVGANPVLDGSFDLPVLTTVVITDATP